ncbi:hypothetical protein LIER_27943 [Lithospermum erythrorhizon]|uniref:Retrovirus-related Pol polyprotein from transposon RE2 n=1 Tax=Lithospermum erythrorhizon TaxID=34254 RepID=A0AAV3RHH8_LITER
MKDLGILKYFWGVEVVRSQEEIFFSQRKYSFDIISETCLLGVKPVGFPMEHNQRLAHSTSAPLKDSERYRRNTSCGEISKRVPGSGILLSAESKLQLSGWCDFDWASCPITRRSIFGWIVFLGNSPVSWKSKKEETVSRSSAEAEYRSMVVVTCELKWLKGLLHCFGVFHAGSIELLCDSQSAMYLAQNPIFHEHLHAPT